MVQSEAGDHLRVCGADEIFAAEAEDAAGSPPRVRSRLPQGFDLGKPFGITSACAEQTRSLSPLWTVGRDHLRVCGADTADSTQDYSDAGSPPRVRSRLAFSDGDDQVMGITSACAEQTHATHSGEQSCWDHLRVCGADTRRQ